MSASINGTTISLTRGDTLKLNIILERGDETYVPDPEDTIRFALKKRIGDNEPLLILKGVPIDTLILKLDPEDTKELDYGTYKYDLELTTADGEVVTFIGPADFIITEEVH